MNIWGLVCILCLLILYGLYALDRRVLRRNRARKRLNARELKTWDWLRENVKRDQIVFDRHKRQFVKFDFFGWILARGAYKVSVRPLNGGKSYRTNPTDIGIMTTIEYMRHNYKNTEKEA